MGIFYHKEQPQGCNTYSLKKYVDRKRVTFIAITIILAIITICLILYYIVDTSLRLNNQKQLLAQVERFQKEKEKVQEIEIKKEKEKQDKIPKLTEVGKENLKNIYQSETKRAFLTFDDGPSINTKSILDILKANNIKATFFVLGSQVETFTETTNRIYNEGHYIANHGYSHRYDNIYQSPEQVLYEYNLCNQIVANTIQVPEYNSHLFRFPGGSVGGKYAQIKNQAISILEQNNILYLDWNALTGDSEKTNPTPEYIMQNLQKTTNNKNSVIVLMHDAQAKQITVDTLQLVIDYLRNEGYEFKSFYEMIK